MTRIIMVKPKPTLKPTKKPKPKFTHKPVPKHNAGRSSWPQRIEHDVQSVWANASAFVAHVYNVLGFTWFLVVILALFAAFNKKRRIGWVVALILAIIFALGIKVEFGTLNI